MMRSLQVTSSTETQFSRKKWLERFQMEVFEKKSLFFVKQNNLDSLSERILASRTMEAIVGSLRSAKKISFQN